MRQVWFWTCIPYSFCCFGTQTVQLLRMFLRIICFTLQELFKDHLASFHQAMWVWNGVLTQDKFHHLWKWPSLIFKEFSVIHLYPAIYDLACSPHSSVVSASEGILKVVCSNPSDAQIREEGTLEVKKKDYFVPLMTLLVIKLHQNTNKTGPMLS